MTREKSNPEDISVVAYWENRERKRERRQGENERKQESKKKERLKTRY